MKKGKQLTAVILAFVLVFGLAGCTRGGAEKKEDKTSSSESKKNGEDLKVVMMPKVMGMPIFESYYNSAKEQADELGITLDYIGPSELDASKQVNLVQDLISGGDTDALLICPADGEALVPVLKEAMDAGIHVYTWDDDVVDESAREYFINMCSDKIYGEQMGKTVGEMLKGKGKIGVVNGNMTATSLTLKEEALQDVLKNEYPDIKVMPTVYHGGDQQKAYALCQDLLTANPDLDLIAVIATPGLLGAAQAVDASGRNEVIVYGAEQPNNIKEYIKKDGLEVVGCLWDVMTLGKEAVNIVYSCLADGKEYKEGDTVEGYPESSVEGTNITFNAVLEFDKDTVDDYNF